MEVLKLCLGYSSQGSLPNGSLPKVASLVGLRVVSLVGYKGEIKERSLQIELYFNW